MYISPFRRPNSTVADRGVVVRPFAAPLSPAYTLRENTYASMAGLSLLQLWVMMTSFRLVTSFGKIYRVYNMYIYTWYVALSHWFCSSTLLNVVMFVSDRKAHRQVCSEDCKYHLVFNAITLS